MSYDIKPHALLDFLKTQYEFKSDGQLCRALGVSAPTLSKIRAGKQNISAAIIITIHKKTGMSIEDIEGFLKEGNVEPDRAEV